MCVIVVWPVAVIAIASIIVRVISVSTQCVVYYYIIIIGRDAEPCDVGLGIHFNAVVNLGGCLNRRASDAQQDE